MKKEKTGVVLLNLGTPDRPEGEDVGRYLREFLMDRHVIDIPWLARWFLVHVLIVPRRKWKSAEAYKKVWGPRGSPLLTHLLDLTEKVALSSRGDFEVEPAMRYGKPNLKQALQNLEAKGCTDLLVAPLYPQFADSTFTTSVEHCHDVLGANPPWNSVRFLDPFFSNGGFISAFAHQLTERTKSFSNAEHVLFSFHGLPERHIRRLDASKEHCFEKPDCCASWTGNNQQCYRAQCFFTAKAIAKKANLKDGEWSVSFQSRLGRTPWIRPYTDDRYIELATAGVRRLLVVCPSFVADCLETLEEVELRGREDFKKAGGEDLALVPCLNAEPIWVEALISLIREQIKTPLLPSYAPEI